MSGLTDRDREVLGELDFTNHNSSYPMRWARPLDVGGSSNNDVSYRLNKLVKLGLVEFKQRWGTKIGGTAHEARMSRGSKVYRVTEQGHAVASDPRP